MPLDDNTRRLLADAECAFTNIFYWSCSSPLDLVVSYPVNLFSIWLVGVVVLDVVGNIDWFGADSILVRVYG